MLDDVDKLIAFIGVPRPQAEYPFLDQKHGGCRRITKFVYFTDRQTNTLFTKPTILPTRIYNKLTHNGNKDGNQSIYKTGIHFLGYQISSLGVRTLLTLSATKKSKVLKQPD